MKKKVLNFGVYLLVLIGIVFAISFYYSREGLKNTEVLNSIEVKAKVLSVDDSEVISSGYSNIGFQSLEVEVLEGEYKEQVFEGTNNLVGQTDIENIFKVGDKIIAALIFEDNKVDYIKAIDLYRQDALFVLFGLFVAALVLYAGVVGVKALISFVLTVFILWEVLVKQVLNGADPIITTTLSLMLLSAVIIFLVAGVNRKGISAFLG